MGGFARGAGWSGDRIVAVEAGVAAARCVLLDDAAEAGHREKGEGIRLSDGKQ